MIRVLIVDDDRFFADVLALAFRLEGYETLVAATADEGIRLGVAHSPDIVVADWMLRSELNGGEVCRRICAARPYTQVIIITGCSEIVSQAARCCQAVVAVIEKPFHTEEIIQAMRRASAGAAIPGTWAEVSTMPAPAPG